MGIQKQAKTGKKGKAVHPRTAPAKPPSLTRDDWLDAAFHAVVDGGFDKVRVLLIADALGVTRGSFYWHFTDHAELISALLMRWKEKEFELNCRLRLNQEPALDAAADLVRLLDAALLHAGDDLVNMRFELALRGLGRRDPSVALMLEEVDQARIDLFQQKFLKLTGNTKKAGELASLFYLAIVGSNQALSRPINPPLLSAYLKGIISQYLIYPNMKTLAR